MADPKNQPRPWERQDGETNKQFEAFCAYRDMGAERSQREVGEKLSKSRQLIGRWAAENNWVERVKAWDDEQDRLNRIQQQREIANMRKRHARLARKALDKATEAIESMMNEDFNPMSIARIMEAASKLERISMGDVGEVVEERPSAEPATSPVVFYIPDNGRD